MKLTLFVIWKMCARLLTCPLCSQPGFLTLDSLRAGLVSVATRPLGCPVCNEILLGIDKLTIHLFSHTINLNNNVNDMQRNMNIFTNTNNSTSNSVQDNSFQDWSVQKARSLEKQEDIIIKAIDTVNTSIKINEKPINVTNPQVEMCHQTPSILLQNHEQAQTSIFQVTNSNDIPKTQNLTEPTKFNFSSQCYCNNNSSMKDTEVQQSNQKNFQKYQTNWIQTITQQPCKKISTVTVQSENVQKSQITSALVTELKDTEKCVMKETSSNTITKETDFPEFPSFSCIMQNCIEPAMNNAEKQSKSKNSKDSTIEQNSLNIPNDTNILNVQQSTSISEISDSSEGIERCDICGFQFSDQNILIMHKKLVHMIEEKDFNSKPEDLLKSYPCHLCSKIFKMRGSLMVHMRVAHTGHAAGILIKDGELMLTSNDNGYKCPTCGKGFRKEQHVVQHLKTHEGKQWECDVCSKMFTTKYFLKKHKRLHSGEMPYKCNICDKTFTFQQSYHKHRLYHKDDKPHTCTICNRSFKELSTLHNHERIHTGEKPFACETCGKCFRQRVSYLVHRRIHTGVMPYKCLSCGKSFRYKVSQRTHKCLAQQQSDSVAQQTDKVATTKKADASTSNDLDILHEANSVQIQPVVYDEKNRYILIIDAQGQHVLTRESDIETVKSQFNNELNNYTSINTDTKQYTNDRYKNLWNSNSTSEETIEACQSQSNINNISKNLKNASPMEPNTNNVFPLVMQPLETTALTEKQILLNPCTNYKQIENSIGINEMNSNLSMNFNGNRTDNSSPLETINEESLKELLSNINER